MSPDIIGQGWAFPPGIDIRGGIALARGDAEVEQAMRIVLLTAKGQRVMRPDFGSRLHELVFAPNNSHTTAQARRFVEEALGMWEPRINVREVTARPDPEYDNALLIEISYEVKATLDKRTLVFPFYLIPEE
ncbi:MAG: GPW/gp25 family protein [Anaerolineales bacterium]|nr:GPW/gp25 family protein [Anaerolineales bacterium]